MCEGSGGTVTQNANQETICQSPGGTPMVENFSQAIFGLNDVHASKYDYTDYPNSWIYQVLGDNNPDSVNDAIVSSPRPMV